MNRFYLPSTALLLAFFLAAATYTPSLSAPKPNGDTSAASSSKPASAEAEAEPKASYAPSECGCRKTRAKLKDRLGPALKGFEPDKPAEE